MHTHTIHTNTHPLTRTHIHRWKGMAKISRGTFYIRTCTHTQYTPTPTHTHSHAHTYTGGNEWQKFLGELSTYAHAHTHNTHPHPLTRTTYTGGKEWQLLLGELSARRVHDGDFQQRKPDV